MLKPKRTIYDATRRSYPDEKLPVLFFFSATWCDSCTSQKPVVAKVEPAYSGRLRLVWVDIDANPALKQAAGVKAVPAFIFVNADRSDGALAIGEQSESELIRFLDSALAL